MNKIALVIKREYLSRIKKKSFVIMTLLGPLLFAAMFVIPAWISGFEDDDEKVIAIIDATGLYANSLEDTHRIKYEYLPVEAEETLKRNFHQSGYYAYLTIYDNLLTKPDALRLVSSAQITIDVKEQIRKNLQEYLKDEKLKSFQIDELTTILSDINAVDVQLSTVKIGSDGDEKVSSTEVTMIISILFAFLSYMFVFLYGTQVLRGVMEEKSNRIIEVIISSIRPFQLMMGKIVGVALVALTQFLLWVILTVVILSGVKSLFFNETDMLSRMDGIETVMNTQEHEEVNSSDFDYAKIATAVEGINFTQILLIFIFYFIGGYLLYAALFAAVGAAIDADTDSQQFILPITIPVIIALYVAMAAFRNPHSAMVFWFSMIPFTSPIVMLARIPFEIPAWQIVISMLLLVGGFILTTWFAARVYRTGILMYGKKVSYRELWKWFKQSGS